MTAFERGLTPKLVCFDSWYGSIENLKLVLIFGLAFFDPGTKLIGRSRVSGGKLQAASDAGLTGVNGTICWLKGFGEIKVFRVSATDGTKDFWATNLE